MPEWGRWWWQLGLLEWLGHVEVEAGLVHGHQGEGRQVRVLHHLRQAARESVSLRVRQCSCY